MDHWDTTNSTRCSNPLISYKLLNISGDNATQNRTLLEHGQVEMYVTEEKAFWHGLLPKKRVSVNWPSFRRLSFSLQALIKYQA